MLKLLFLILAIPISGVVTNQRSGKGIEGVVVSDGYHCTVTDSNGRYTLDADSLARTVSITVPAEYEIPMGKDGRPAFFKYIGDEDLNFRLKARHKISNEFTLIAVSDAHVRDSMNVTRFRTESLPDIQRTMSRHACDGPVIGMGLGDQLWDVMDRWNVIKEGFSGFRARRKTVPFFYCIGNHDHESGAGNTDHAVTEHFVRHFGPTDYSFDIGSVHFVVMDDIQHTGTQRDGIKISYTTGITDAQLKWLQEDLSLVKDKKAKAIVFCVHSPLYGRFSHKPEVKALLEEFAEAHVLSGHEHNINNLRHDDGRIWEHNIQALCGAWWFSNLSPSGCPLGYVVLTFDGSSLAEEYNKATTESAGFQMRVYSGNDSYGPDTPGFTGEPKRTNVYSWPEEFKGHFVARVWDGTPAWEVKLVCGGKEYPMKQTEVKFFDAASAAYMVDVFGAPFGGSGIYKAKVDAFWTVEAPCGDPALEKNWEVVAVHRMPSGKKVTYRSRVLMRDYIGFAAGTHYLK